MFEKKLGTTLVGPFLVEPKLAGPFFGRTQISRPFFLVGPLYDFFVEKFVHKGRLIKG